MKHNSYVFDESRWPFRPARWWQFWRPRSGLIGGMIFSLVLSGAGWLIVWLSKL